MGWLLLRLFKYQQLTEENTLTRLCWYGYYLFQLALPVVLLLYLTEILDSPEGEKRLSTSPVAAILSAICFRCCWC